MSVSEGSDNVIIDGQQRLTTVSLLLLALRNLIVAGEVPCDQANLADKITNDYLVDQWQPEDRKIKLKPVKDDMKAFNRLFTDPDDLLEASKVTQNYRFFHRAIQDRGVKADDLFSAIRRLIIIDITLEDGDNPQLIFESLNSTGLDLSEADEIRNYVLMGLPGSLQDKKNYYKAAVAGKPARRSRRWRERRFPKPQDYTRVVNAAHHLHAHKNRRQDITLSIDMRKTRIMVQRHRIAAKPLHVNGTLRGRRFPMQRAFLNSYPPCRSSRTNWTPAPRPVSTNEYLDKIALR